MTFQITISPDGRVVAVKAVNRFGWGAAGVAGLMPVFVGMALTVCAWIGLIVVMSFSGLPLPL
ncbi:MAG: hypothetical protein NZ534_09750, partial [Bacteroidia bacterium]|nr:hypothetical protein [Bacteroidia bacterium]